MSKKNMLLLGGLGIVGLAILILVGRSLISADVLNPQGIIADKQFGLIVFASLLMALIIVPVFVMTFLICWKYRDGNKKPKPYQPNWDGSKLYESIWWGFPILIILVLSIVTWQSSHQLDPFKPIASHKKALTIQVVALQWKWLFIYPEQHIATVNYVKFPEKRPVKFEITSDAPMNAFWIPALAGQMYAMSGMQTQLNLQANGIGKYRGSSTNISGAGFADMNFTASSTSEQDFSSWVQKTRLSPRQLTADTYQKLVAPKTALASSYALDKNGLFQAIMQKYRPQIASNYHSGDEDHH